MAKRPSARSKRTCLFCGANEISGEHLYPDWLATEFRRAGQVAQGRGSHANPPAQHYHWLGLPFRVKVRAVCRACNTGWMSDLENDAKSILLPMVRGKDVSLSSADQRTLAVWATKTALVVHSTHQRTHRIVAASHYANFYRTRGPLVNSKVWLAAYGGTQHLGQYEARQVLWNIVQGEATRMFDGFAVVLIIGKLIVQLFGSNTQGVDFHLQHGPYPGQMVVQTWPIIADPAPWPPVVPFDDARLPQLTAMWDEVRV